MNEEKNQKALQEKSFIMDINFLEAPFFLFNQDTKALKVKDLKQDICITNDVRHILELHNNDNSEVKYFSWKDSKGLKREMIAISVFNLPRKFTMDVWYGLIGLYIKKSSPIVFNDHAKSFDIQSDKLYFTLYELAKFMKITTGGANIKKIKDAIRKLDSTQYLSFSNGSIYDKKNEEYIKSTEKGLRLIVNYEFNTEKKKSKTNSTKNKCWVQLNSLIVDNIKHEFIKYLNSEVYFSLPSGLTRGLYTYLEGNKYTCNGPLSYIKRSFQVLGNKIPIEFKYNSNFKRRIKKPLDNLIQQRIISDYFFGDEYIIREKEYCIYFIFKGTKEDIIKSLKEKHNEVKEIKEEKDRTNEFNMVIPDNLDKALEELGFTNSAIKSLKLDFDKWEIIKYIIWLEKQQFESKKPIKNPAGLLRFALTGNVNLKIGYKDIIEFVDSEKEKEHKNSLSKEEIVKTAYNEYVEKEVFKFKESDEATYNIIYENTLMTMNSQVDDEIKKLQLLENNINEKLPVLELWKEFKEDSIESKIFKENLLKSIKILRDIEGIEEFTRKFKF